MTLPRISRIDLNDDELSRACSSLLAYSTMLGGLQHRLSEMENTAEMVDQLHKDDDAVAIVLGMLEREQVARRKDDQEAALP